MRPVLPLLVLPLLALLAIAASAGTATAAEPARSLLFADREWHALRCAAAGTPTLAPDVPTGSGLPAQAHLTALIYRSPTVWEFRLNGVTATPGHLPAGVVEARVGPDSVRLLWRDASGREHANTLSVGDRVRVGGEAGAGAPVAAGPGRRRPVRCIDLLDATGADGEETAE